MAPFTCSRLPRRPAARDIDDPHNRLSTARVWGSSCTFFSTSRPRSAIHFVYSADSDPPAASPLVPSALAYGRGGRVYQSRDTTLHINDFMNRSMALRPYK
ncbi:hypothetical protein KCV03_g238, partial [Aureobasidium melanogenum]